jgi:hypothetical protein
MGQARQRQTLLQRKLAEQPWCIYCGGTTAGTSVDHMPPTGVCDDRQRPPGMEFVACSECHDGTRKADQVAGLMCRTLPNSPSPTAKQELAKILAGVRNNQPDVFNELAPSLQQLLVARRARGVLDAGGVFSIGDITHQRMMQFGARATLALHYHLTGQIVPAGGLVFVVWHTNEVLFSGAFPDFIARKLPAPQTLNAGRKTLGEQFQYSSRETDDKCMTAHTMTFRLSFAVQSAVAVDAAGFSEQRRKMPMQFFEPGFLKALATSKAG